MAKARTVDFTGVKEGGGQFNKIRQPVGDYEAKILKVATVEKKKQPGEHQWVWTIQAGAGKYPYYTGFGKDELWKIRNLAVAAGINVPKKKVNFDPNRLVGKTIGVTLEDDEYDGKNQSSINAVFPPSELEGNTSSDDDDDDDDDDEDEDTSTDTEDDEEEDSSDEEEEDDEEEEEPPPPPKKKKKKVKPAAEEVDELDIEDI